MHYFIWLFCEGKPFYFDIINDQLCVMLFIDDQYAYNMLFCFTEHCVFS